MRSQIAALLTLGLFAGGISAQQPQRAPAREIVNVKGDIYRARNNNYFSLFMVTPEGIILADPINAAFATWMKEQFAERFKVPVRYVIYSHSHWDHVEGGSVFADTARFIAHENMARNMDGRIPQMPGDMLDRNNNGRFELDEIVGPLTNNQGRCGMPASSGVKACGVYGTPFHRRWISLRRPFGGSAFDTRPSQMRMPSRSM